MLSYHEWAIYAQLGSLMIAELEISAVHSHPRFPKLGRTTEMWGKQGKHMNTCCLIHFKGSFVSLF